ncbi:hypothetical protein Tco_0828121 [Tanacetum coccineum]
MGDENPRRTLGDYSRPNREGYQNTIEVPNGNDLAPLRSDTIRTYSKKSLTMAFIFGSKSKSSMIESASTRGGNPNGPYLNRSFNNASQGSNQSNLEEKMTNFMASQDAKTSRFEADFKQYQSEVTNKLDTFLKAFNDQMTRLLPSDTVKNPKLNTNPTLSARSHPAGDP